MGCRSSPARPKVAPTPHPPHGARSAPLSCLSPTPLHRPVPPAWGSRSPIVGTGGPAQPPDPPSFVLQTEALSPVSRLGPARPVFAVLRAVRCALLCADPADRQCRNLPCGAVPCSALGAAAPPAPGDASTPLSLSCRVPATRLSCPRRTCPSYAPIASLSWWFPVVPLSCPCHIPVAPCRRRHGRTDACWTSRANCRTWARPRGAGNAADTRGARRGRPGSERGAPVGSKRRRWRRSCGGCRRAWRRRGVRERRCVRGCGRSCGRRRRSCERCGRRGIGCAERRRRRSTSTARRRRRARCGSCVRCCTASRAAS